MWLYFSPWIILPIYRSRIYNENEQSSALSVSSDSCETTHNMDVIPSKQNFREWIGELSTTVDNLTIDSGPNSQQFNFRKGNTSRVGSKFLCVSIDFCFGELRAIRVIESLLLNANQTSHESPRVLICRTRSFATFSIPLAELLSVYCWAPKESLFSRQVELPYRRTNGAPGYSVQSWEKNIYSFIPDKTSNLVWLLFISSRLQQFRPANPQTKSWHLVWQLIVWNSNGGCGTYWTPGSRVGISWILLKILMAR